MSTKSNVIKGESVCATCLSHDRNLVTVRDSQLCTIFCSEFSLNVMDKICWECHHLVRKMVSFKRKAQKAQEFLRFTNNGQNDALQKHGSLSSLSISVGINLTISCTKTDQNHTNSDVLIKQEPPQDITEENEFDSCNIDIDEDIINKFMINKNDSDMILVKNEHTNKQFGTEKQMALIEKQGSHTEKQLALIEKQEPHSEKQMALIEKQDSHTEKGMPLINKQDTHSEKQTTLIKKQTALTEKQQSHGGKHMTKSKCQVFTHKKRDTSSCSDKIRKQRGLVTNDLESMYSEIIITEDKMVEWRKEKRNMQFYTNSIPMERCESCLEPFDTEALAVAHAQRHTEMYGEIVCDVCTMRAPDEKSMAVHKLWHYRLLSCRNCDFVWDNVNTMRSHCRERHNVKMNLWDCDLCDRQFQSFKLVKLHENRTHSRQKCEECGVVVFRVDMRHHKRQHNVGVQWLACPVCLKKCRGQLALDTHLSKHHTEVNPSTYCIPCRRQYHDVSGYNNHMRYSQKHVNDVYHKHKCDTCGMRYLMARGLRKHVMDVHHEHPCGQCGKVLIGIKQFKDHIKVHRIPKEFICDYCGKVFKTKEVIRSHINTHTGARPFACHLCGADFGHSSARYLHLRYKHKVPKKTEKTRSETN